VHIPDDYEVRMDNATLQRVTLDASDWSTPPCMAWATGDHVIALWNNLDCSFTAQPLQQLKLADASGTERPTTSVHLTPTGTAPVTPLTTYTLVRANQPYAATDQPRFGDSSVVEINK